MAFFSLDFKNHKLQSVVIFYSSYERIHINKIKLLDNPIKKKIDDIIFNDLYNKVTILIEVKGENLVRKKSSKFQQLCHKYTFNRPV